MKKIIIILFTAHCSLLTFHQLHAQWEWQNPLPNGHTINDISYIDENTGWTAGYWGSVTHTSNGGETWVLQETGVENTLYGICFFDAMHGWAVGSESIILHTEDGGQSWYAQMEGSRLPSSLTDVCFIDQYHGWAVGERMINLKSLYIYYTSDGGDTWNSQMYGSLDYVSTASVYFVDELEGWITWNSEIIHTVDGGLTWEPQTSNTDKDLNGLHFVDKDHGWIAGDQGTVLFTSNGGELWEVSHDTTLGGNHDFMDVSFVDASIGWVAGDALIGWGGGWVGKILKTEDGGHTWELQLDDPDLEPINSIECINASKGFTAGTNGEMLKTEDGSNWMTLSASFTKADFKCVYFTDILNGWAAGEQDTGDAYAPAMYHTNDGGLTWSEQDIPLSAYNYLYNVFFVDPQHGWALAWKSQSPGGATLIHTTDGGENWILQSTEDVSGDIFFLDQSTGWRVGKDGIIQKTSDGGSNWEDLSSGTNNYLEDLIFIGENNGWVCGDSVILKTHNGGGTWEEQYFDDSYWRDIWFVDSLHGWVVSPGHGFDHSKMMRTTDGGATWKDITIDDFTRLDQVFFIDSSIGWVFGTSYPTDRYRAPEGNIWRTNDGGESWELQNLTTYHIHGGFCFVDANNGWAVGNNGTILHTTNGGMLGFREFDIQRSSLVIDVYPNPARGIVNLQFTIYGLQSVSLRIFDLKGQEVADVLDGVCSGDQVVRWDATNLPAGIYFLKATSGNNPATQKLIIQH